MEKVNKNMQNISELEQKVVSLRKELQMREEQDVLPVRRELFNLKLTKVSGQVKDYSQFKKLRHKIANSLTTLSPVKTALRNAEKELDAAKKSVATK